MISNAFFIDFIKIKASAIQLGFKTYNNRFLQNIFLIKII